METITICDNSPEVWFDSRVAVFVPAMAGTQDVDRLKIQVKSSLSQVEIPHNLSSRFSQNKTNLVDIRQQNHNHN